MNLLAATLEGEGLRIGEAMFPLPPALAAAARQAPRRGLLVGVRPDALSVEAAGGPGTIGGAVALVEHIGAESLLSVRLAQARTGHEEEGQARDEVMATSPGYSDLGPGSRVGLCPDFAEAVLFSAETGHRIREA